MNENLTKFAANPVNLDINRSTFDRSSTYKTTYKSGDLVPFFVDEILPGDTFNVDTAMVNRMLTPIVPIMDNSFLDFFYFFVPHRLSAAFASGDPKSWEKICGENTSGPWAVKTETFVPMINPFLGNEQSIKPMSIGNYLGLPICTLNTGVSALPSASYQIIWNEWFRDQNTQTPKVFDNMLLSKDPYKVNKFHDYFTSCLPAPQKGDSVFTPLGGSAPVAAAAPGTNLNYLNNLANKYGLRVVTNKTDNTSYTFPTSGTAANDTTKQLLVRYTKGNEYANANARLSPLPTDITGGSAPDRIMFDNLVADLSLATGATINELRQSFAIQKMLEKDARGGTRYREILKTHFNVSIPDSTLQRPEYLGGKRIPLTVTQVLQTTPTQNTTPSTSPLGFTGAYSNTSSNDKSFVKSFSEYGLIIGVFCVRTMQSYSQGIPRIFTKNRRFDFYWPTFANLGEQPIKNKEIYYDDNVVVENEEVFGYQEAWADYRYKPSMITGLLAPGSNDLTLRPWTYTNDFTFTPVLNSSFMTQSPKNIGQTLTYEATGSQFLIDIYIKCSCTRPLPMFSIPGLIDHH